VLDPERGVPGDKWESRPDRTPDSQITLMREDVARIFAHRQPLSLFGDNLIADLDISEDALPVGSRVRIGAALLEVTSKPHRGCAKFRERFGGDALKLTASPHGQRQRWRGVYFRVVEAGEIAVGDAVAVVGRPE